MTLVPSRQQQLNGNKMKIGQYTFLLFLLFSTLLSANNGIKEQLPPYKKEYKVVLMLPFCIGMPDKWKVRDIMAEYYEGVEMAIADLESQGLKMKLTVLDTKMDSLEVIRLLQNPAIQETDLMIGPVYDNELFEVEKFCAIYKIPLVSPLRYYPNTLGTDFPLINCNTVDSLQYYYTGKHAASAFKKFQVVVVDDVLKNTRTFAARNFKKGYELASGLKCQIIDGKLITIESIWNKKDSLMVFYTGKSSSSCSQGISAKNNPKCIVVGPTDWLDIDRVSYNSLNGLYFYGTYSVPYNDTTYKVFRKAYRSKYGGDPDRYTFIGYDQFSFFGMALMAFDNGFYKNILNKEFNYTHRTFHFVQRGNLIENAGLNLFYYENYNFYKAFWRY